ncbi:putative polysaccharide biosynthesis protein [Paramaledivibacter caminithermalis]|uniref:Stage V sporulation protein B n=1 Tax=Paramaledivibacter caminithermalis (strain DSM 15212 / CIP 107654 / DViRD3) TaxID=1121301 RepID=A0A1M6Q5A4_PARC5|nr:polysaccharide biosynthesis protein [Paramaledivibacter caminithermalis]SHK15382.1 stage V sporulation protein B [Paramaledivibacter caminithermalis DSM 15212]
MKKNSFIYSTIILVIANFFARFIGFIYKILLSRLLGSEGIGLYHLIFHTFLVIITITSSGIPVALSKIIAQKISVRDYKSCKITLYFSLILGLTISILLCILTFKNQDFFIKYIIKSNKLEKSLIALIPAIPIVTLSSIFRSYYYGIKKVTPSANAQIIEQLSRVIFVIGFLHVLNPQDLKTSVMIATLGITVGEAAGLLFLIAKFKSHSKYIINYGNSKLGFSDSASLLWKFLAISFPITIPRLVSVLMQSVNMFLVPRRLQMAGYSLEQSVTAFGEVVGMSMPLLFLPFIVTSALVVNLIPNISAENALMKSSNIEMKSLLALRITLLISIPIAFIFLFFGAPICGFLYNKPSVGIYLKYLSYSLIFLSLHHIIAGILHGLGKQILTTINYLIGMTTHLICIYFLVSIPKIGVLGFIIGFILSSFIMFFLNLTTLKHFITIKIEIINHIIKPIISSIFMIIVIIFSNKYLTLLSIPTQIDILISTFIGGFIYLLSVFVTGSIKFQTIKSIFSFRK